MSLQSRLVAAGLSAIQAQAIQGTAADGLTATGAVQATAFPLAADVNHFTTTAAGTGCIIPAANPGDSGTIQNGGANALLVYPPVGGKMNNLGTNAGYSMAANTAADWYCVSPTQYIISAST
jgi:hypothetical protein